MQETLDIESLDMEARGVAHREGKVVFVEGALPGERVVARPLKTRPSYEVAEVERVLSASTQRVLPRCRHFGVCGGCAMQHLEPAAQVAVKQRVLEDAFAHIGKLKPATMLAPLQGPAWGYRFRARLSVRVVPSQGGVLIGFRERKSSFVADIRECHVLPAHVSHLLEPLHVLVAGLSAPDRVPQIELAVGDQVTVLVLRHLTPLKRQDIELLRGFGEQHGISWWLQPGGPETAHPLVRGDDSRLAYLLPAYGLRMPYRPTDFTQVNHALNRVLVVRALALLQCQPQDRVADLFCGLGNFSLPLASCSREVVGVEGSSALTERARLAAAQHGLADKAHFQTLNLFEIDVHWLRSLGYFDRMLIDPPRDGAQALAEALTALLPAERPRRIVYVSCNPATLARDVAIMTRKGGYRLEQAGVINMFPHTAHVESIAVLS